MMKADLVAFSGQSRSRSELPVFVVMTGNLNGRSRETLGRLRYLAAPVALFLSEQTAELWEIKRDLPTKPFLEAPREKWQNSFREVIASILADKYRLRKAW